MWAEQFSLEENKNYFFTVEGFGAAHIAATLVLLLEEGCVPEVADP